MPRQRNPLLARPPAYATQQSFAGMDPELRFGVHTTFDFVIAALYATTAERTMGGYGVVLDLDMSGLEPLPDYDAVLYLDSFLTDEGIREGYEGYTLAEAASEDFDPNRGMTDNPFAAYAEARRDPFAGFTEESFQRWVETGGYDVGVLAGAVNQRRYMANVGVERLRAVYAFRPVYPRMLDVEIQSEEAEALVALGWQVVDLYGDISSLRLDVALLAERAGGGIVIDPRKARVPFRGEYHGTTSDVVASAFGLVLPPSPFPTFR